jgi:hypothetical protein
MVDGALTPRPFSLSLSALALELLRPLLPFVCCCCFVFPIDPCLSNVSPHLGPSISAFARHYCGSTAHRQWDLLFTSSIYIYTAPHIEEGEYGLTRLCDIVCLNIDIKLALIDHPHILGRHLSHLSPFVLARLSYDHHTPISRSIPHPEIQLQ